MPNLANVTPAKLDRLRAMIAEQALHKADQHYIASASGERSNWLMDMRTIFLDSDGIDLVTDVFWEVFADFDELQIAGLELGSIPFIGALVLKGKSLGKRVNGLVVRRSRKKQGLLKRVEGQISSAPIVMVDDLMNSGTSLTKVLLALRDEGRGIDHAFVFIRYREPTVEFRRALGSDVLHLFNIEDFGVSLKSSQGTLKAPMEYDTAWVFIPDVAPPRYQIVVPKCNPAVDDERVYFGTDARIFYAVDLKTGKKVWEHQANRAGSQRGIWSSPAVHNGRVFYGAYDGNLYCLDAKTGANVWTNGDADYMGSSPAIAEDLGCLFIGMEFGFPPARGSLQALDLETGEKRWQYDVRELLHGSACYSKLKQVVGIGTNDSTFAMLDARNGRELWMFRCKAPVKWRGCFGPNDEVVAFSSHDGNVYVLNVDTGRLVYTMRGEFSFIGAPLIVGDHVIAGNTDKSIYIGNYRTKEPPTRIDTDGRIFATPALIDGSVWLGNNAGALFQISPEQDWQVVGRYQLPDRVLTKPVASPVTRLNYVVTGDGRLFAFKPMPKA